MGYTHYWNIKKGKILDDLTLEIISQIIKENNSMLSYGYSYPNTPEMVSKDMVRLNGKDDDAHEDFHIEFNKEVNDFCKTAEKPYDAMVCQILIALKIFYKNNIIIKSDGIYGDQDEEAWHKAVKWMKGIYISNYDIFFRNGELKVKKTS
jgi:hypothetical protein